MLRAPTVATQAEQQVIFRPDLKISPRRLILIPIQVLTFVVADDSMRAVRVSVRIREAELDELDEYKKLVVGKELLLIFCSVTTLGWSLKYIILRSQSSRNGFF